MPMYKCPNPNCKPTNVKPAQSEVMGQGVVWICAGCDGEYRAEQYTPPPR